MRLPEGRLIIARHFSGGNRPKKEIRAVGTAERRRAKLRRPYGTRLVLLEAFPPVKLAGYFRGAFGTDPEFLDNYSAAASFSITTFKCAVTSLCSFTGTVNSPRVLSGSWSWIWRRSRVIPFFAMASAKSPEVTEPNR